MYLDPDDYGKLDRWGMGLIKEIMQYGAIIISLLIIVAVFILFLVMAA